MTAHTEGEQEVVSLGEGGVGESPELTQGSVESSKNSGDKGKSNGDSVLCAEAGNSCRVGPGLLPEKGEVACWVQSWKQQLWGQEAKRVT